MQRIDLVRQQRAIPLLNELLFALISSKPEDPIEYLIQTLEKIASDVVTARGRLVDVRRTRKQHTELLTTAKRQQKPVGLTLLLHAAQGGDAAHPYLHAMYNDDFSRPRGSYLAGHGAPAATGGIVLPPILSQLEHKETCNDAELECFSSEFAAKALRIAEQCGSSPTENSKPLPPHSVQQEVKSSTSQSSPARLFVLSLDDEIALSAVYRAVSSRCAHGIGEHFPALDILLKAAVVTAEQPATTAALTVTAAVMEREQNDTEGHHQEFPLLALLASTDVFPALHTLISSKPHVNIVPTAVADDNALLLKDVPENLTGLRSLLLASNELHHPAVWALVQGAAADVPSQFPGLKAALDASDRTERYVGLWLLATQATRSRFPQCAPQRLETSIPTPSPPTVAVQLRTESPSLSMLSLLKGALCGDAYPWVAKLIEASELSPTTPAAPHSPTTNFPSLALLASCVEAVSEATGVTLLSVLASLRTC